MEALNRGCVVDGYFLIYLHPPPTVLQDVIGCQVDSVAKDSSALRLELIFVHHRIDCKLSIIQSGIGDLFYDY